MNEEQLGNLLRRLPRERASEGFTDRVLSRLDEARRPRLLPPRLALAAGGVLGLLAVAWLGADRWQAERREEMANQRIRSLRDDIERVQNDIRLLRDLAPVLYLGGNENVDFVLDLRKVAGGKGENGLQTSSFESPAQKGEGKRW